MAKLDTPINVFLGDEGGLKRSRATSLAVRASRFGLFIRTIGLRRAKVKVGLANLVYNIDRLIFHERHTAMG